MERKRVLREIRDRIKINVLSWLVDYGIPIGT